MSVGAAINFLDRAQKDDDFRRECYKCKSRAELMDTLEQQGYKFDEFEMENAVNHLLCRCQDQEEAADIYLLKSWFLLFG